MYVELGLGSGKGKTNKKQFLKTSGNSILLDVKTINFQICERTGGIAFLRNGKFTTKNNISFLFFVLLSKIKTNTFKINSWTITF